MTVFFYVSACAAGIIIFQLEILLITVLSILYGSIESPLLYNIGYACNIILFGLILVTQILAHIKLWYLFGKTMTPKISNIKENTLEGLNGFAWMYNQEKKAIYTCFNIFK